MQGPDPDEHRGPSRDTAEDGSSRRPDDSLRLLEEEALGVGLGRALLDEGLLARVRLAAAELGVLNGGAGGWGGAAPLLLWASGAVDVRGVTGRGGGCVNRLCPRAEPSAALHSIMLPAAFVPVAHEHQRMEREAALGGGGVGPRGALLASLLVADAPSSGEADGAGGSRQADSEVLLPLDIESQQRVAGGARPGALSANRRAVAELHRVCCGKQVWVPIVFGLAVFFFVHLDFQPVQKNGMKTLREAFAWLLSWI